ncbi:MAG: N-acetylneuraminate synthase, partial [Oscillospiraceae bacterium]|nr:N-acetylneuraminate synthase [Oscillospiraceae bacterium]
AIESGVDAIKFQTFIAEKSISKFAEKAEYQKSSNPDESQLSMVKKLQLSFNDFSRLKKYCDEKGVMFLSTPFDHDSIDFLETLDIPLWKIPSGEITNLPYLEKIAKAGKEIIISTGMATMEEIKDALKVLDKAEKITVLHCNTEYPTPMEDVNLTAMSTLKSEFNVAVGYSDHTLGIEIPIAAVALGATVIEKHFTLNKNMEGPDHKASLNPAELKVMVDAIRNIEQAMGNGIKEPSPSESKNKSIARKSIVARINIKKGEMLTADNLTVKRPGNGISPMNWHIIIGSVAQKDFNEDELITI